MFTLLEKRFNTEPELRHVVYKHFLKSAVVPLCSLVSLMLVLYFGGTYYAYEASLSEIRERAKSTVTEIVRSEARGLEQTLQEVARNTDYLQTVAKRIFTHDPMTYSGQAAPTLGRTENGVSYRDLDTIMDGSTIYGSSLPSSLYIPANTELSGSLKQRLQTTEALDLHFQRTVDSNPVINSAYFNSWDATNRTYPPVADVPALHESGKLVTSSTRYYLADTVHNPDRKAVWASAHLDNASQGWMFSSVAPVYRHGFMEGVIGVDIALQDFAANLMSTSLVWDSLPLIIEENGNILSIPEKGKALLGVLSPIETTSEAAVSGHNLFQHKAFAEIALKSFINGSESASCCVVIKGEEYLLSQQKISETDWRLVIMTPMHKVTQQAMQYKQFINNLGVYFVILTSLFFILFLSYLKKQASNLASRVSNPIELVTDYISRLNKLGNNKPLPAAKVGIRELDRLISSGAEIQLARSRLGRMNEELEQKNDQLQMLAVTDRLTGLYNRHKLDEIIASEMAKAQRYNNHFVIAMLDIDHFKRVNDTYGHQVGDSILVGVSSIMRRRVRNTDIVGRWGGEEFLILLPNTSLKLAAKVLNELRDQLSRSNFEPVESLTISLGLASSGSYRDEDSIVAAADEALYRAKNNGRNRLEINDVYQRVEEMADA